MPQQKDLLRLVYKKTNWLSLQKINPNNWKWHLLGKCTFNKRKYNLDLYDAKVYKNKPTDEFSMCVRLENIWLKCTTL